MKKYILLLAFFFIPITAQAKVEITEIMYDLEGADEKREWIEIFNNSPDLVDLSVWNFFENDTNHKLNGDTILKPGAYAVIADNEEGFRTDNPRYTGPLIDSSFSLKNSGEYLAIKDTELNIIDQLTYDSAWGGNGNGKTLEKTSAGTWQESALAGGTPGLPNSNSQEGDAPEKVPEKEDSVLPEVVAGPKNQLPVISAGPNLFGLTNAELIFNGEGKDPEGDELVFSWNFGDGKTSFGSKASHSYFFPGDYLATLIVSDGKIEIIDTISVTIYQSGLLINEFYPEKNWVELFNSSDEVIDLSGWKVNNLTLPPKSFIQPKAYLALPEVEIKGSVSLFYPNGLTAQDIKYEEAKNYQSINLTSSGGYYWSLTPTPGSDNLIQGLVKAGQKTIASPRVDEKTRGPLMVEFQKPLEPVQKETETELHWEKTEIENPSLLASFTAALPLTLLPSGLTGLLTAGIILLFSRIKKG